MRTVREDLEGAITSTDDAEDDPAVDSAKNRQQPAMVDRFTLLPSRPIIFLQQLKQNTAYSQEALGEVK
jgi:hypothetical protein